MSVKVAINGFGRIGRLAFRQMFGAEGYEIVAINDLTSAKMLAHLLKYDSTQGNYVAMGHTVDYNEGEGEDNYIVVDGKKVVIYKMPNAAELPWGKLALLCPRPRTPVLLPPGLLPPQDSPVRAYHPQAFTARVIVAAARQAMEQTDGRGLIGLLDPQGVTPWACGEWLCCCRGVRVYTLRRSRYAAIEMLLREQYGRPRLWAETPAGLEDCTLCAAPVPTGVIRVRRPVLCADRSGVQGSPTVNRLALLLPPPEAAEVPPGVAPTAFWGMVTECGPRRVALPLTIGQCRIDGRLAEFGGLARLIHT